MNAKELEVKINEANFPKNSYTLFSQPKDETLCIQRAATAWMVFYSERGLQTNEREFSSEDSACDYFYKELDSWFKNK